MRRQHPSLAARISNYYTCVSSAMALRCPCMDHLHYISTYISPSRQRKSIVQLCRSDYYTCISSTKELPPATMCQTTESSNALTQSGQASTWSKCSSASSSWNRKDNDDVLMLMCTRAKSVTSLQPVWDDVQMRKPLLVSAEPWSPSLASCTNGISDDRKLKSATRVEASSIWKYLLLSLPHICW